MEKESKEIIKDEKEVNTGSPKSGNGYGDGGPIVVTSRVQTNNEGVQLSVSNPDNSESTLMKAGENQRLEGPFTLLTKGKKQRGST